MTHFILNVDTEMRFGLKKPVSMLKVLQAIHNFC